MQKGNDENVSAHEIANLESTGRVDAVHNVREACVVAGQPPSGPLSDAEGFEESSVHRVAICLENKPGAQAKGKI